MPKEQLAYNPDKPLPPSVVFQTPEANGIDEIKYVELRARAINDNSELEDVGMLQLVEERITNMMAAIPPSHVNTFIDLAMRHRTEVNSMINGYISDIKTQKQKKRLH